MMDDETAELVERALSNPRVAPAALADAADAMRRVLAGRGLVSVTNADGERVGPAREREADVPYVVYGEPVG